MKNLTDLALDIISPVKPEQILSGKKMFRPFMKFQKAWMAHFYPTDTLSIEKHTWHYLQKYMMPLIEKHASSYHIRGIRALKLNLPQQPDFNELQYAFEHISKGFKIEPVCCEINPREYFELIQQKRFPCIKRMRSQRELFCANKPDFWHESIGHIAPLCFPEAQEFYLEIADYMLSTKTEAQFEKHLAVAWTLMEYGFIKEQGKNKMFGAALVGSHLAHMRYINGLISVEPAERATIINSGFFSEIAPLAKDSENRLRFFCLNNLNTNHLLFE